MKPCLKGVKIFYLFLYNHVESAFSCFKKTQVNENIACFLGNSVWKPLKMIPKKISNTGKGVVKVVWGWENIIPVKKRKTFFPVIALPRIILPEVDVFMCIEPISCLSACRQKRPNTSLYLFMLHAE